MGVVTPLNNPGGPEGDTVTVAEKLLNTEYWDTTAEAAPANKKPCDRPTTPSALITPNPMLQELSTTPQDTALRPPSPTCMLFVQVPGHFDLLKKLCFLDKGEQLFKFYSIPLAFVY